MARYATGTAAEIRIQQDSTQNTFELEDSGFCNLCSNADVKPGYTKVVLSTFSRDAGTWSPL